MRKGGAVGEKKKRENRGREVARGGWAREKLKMKGGIEVLLRSKPSGEGFSIGILVGTI